MKKQVRNLFSKKKMKKVMKMKKKDQKKKRKMKKNTRLETMISLRNWLLLLLKIE
jgi:hypothetical protein